MTWTVVWTPPAEAELTHCWLDAVARDEVTRKANQIDRRLALSPLTVGESRAGQYRILFELPFGIHFEVNQATRAVHVVHFWRVGNRRSS
jgi:mRNA-degrading endonuclease RelE of RelBE toxin-antitoxin system